MESAKMDLIYSEIANILLAIIPEQWDKVLVYSEVREEYESMYFYYYPKDKSTPMYSLDIVDDFDVDEDFIEEKEIKLYDCFRSLWNEFKNEEQEQRTHLTFILDCKGKMKVDFYYDEVRGISPVEKRNQWFNKYLN